jgi:hypothetical protein
VVVRQNPRKFHRPSFCNVPAFFTIFAQHAVSAKMLVTCLARVVVAGALVRKDAPPSMRIVMSVNLPAQFSSFNFRLFRAGKGFGKLLSDIDEIIF